ncbi:MAG: LysR substrate-binding domain-containing protein [Pseudomonadota bacterium]
MPSLLRKTPSANSLVVFDVAARQLSFSRAALELGTTRVAVSNQVKLLEAHLGVRLFERLHRRLRLTRAGEILAQSIARSFSDIAIALDRVAALSEGNQLSVSVSQGMSSHWLMPRIHRFRMRHPDIDIRFQISDAYVDLQAEGIDVALRYGDGSWRGVQAKRLVQVRRFPVCSPDYLERRGSDRSLDALHKHDLLYLSGRYGKLTHWDEWLREVGLEQITTRRGLTFDDHNSLIEAVLAGQGVALAGPPQIAHYLANGQLIRLFDGLETRHRYFWIVELSERLGKPSVSAFTAWLEEEIAASMSWQDRVLLPR